MITLFITLFFMSATGAMLVLCLSLLYPMTKKAFSSTWHYRMCILVMLFLFLPIGIIGGSLLTNIQSTTNQINLNLQNMPAIINDLINVQQPAVPQETKQYSPQKYPVIITPAAPISPAVIVKMGLPLLPFIWLTGVFVFLIRYGVQFIRFKKKIINTSLQIENTARLLILEDAMVKMRISRKIILLSNNMINTPMLTGLFKKYLILPEVEMSERELEVILKHELIHFRRHDLWVKSLALIAKAIHWFNPAVYRLTKNIDTFCELSCDEQVVSDMNIEERHFYSETILNVLCRVINQHSRIHATLVESKKGFKRRLTHLMNFKKKPRRVVIISLFVTAVLCLSGFTAASLMNITAIGKKAAEIQKYRLKIEAGEGGTIPAGLENEINGDYKKGDKISVIAREMPGYRFDNWASTNGGSFADEKASQTTFIMPGSNTVITANFMWQNETQPPSTITQEPIKETITFSSISPDHKTRLESVLDADSQKLRLVETETGNTSISHSYPVDTQFTAVWSEDSYYVAVAGPSPEHNGVVILVADKNDAYYGQGIYIKDLSKLIDPTYPDGTDVQVIPLEFIDDSTLLLSIDWIDADGNQNTGTAKWDFKHGTYTDIVTE